MSFKDFQGKRPRVNLPNEVLVEYFRDLVTELGFFKQG